MATIAQRVEALEDFRDNQQRPWNKATSARFTALEARIAKLETGSTPTPPTPVPNEKVVAVSNWAALRSALADNTVDRIIAEDGRYAVGGGGGTGWIGAAFAGRTRPVTVQARNKHKAIIEGGWLSFEEGVHDQTWDGFRFSNMTVTSNGVLTFGGYLARKAPHHITWRNFWIDDTCKARDPNGSQDHGIYPAHGIDDGPHHLVFEDFRIDGANLNGALHSWHPEAGQAGFQPHDITWRRGLITKPWWGIVAGHELPVYGYLFEDLRIEDARRSAVAWYELKQVHDVTFRRVTSVRSASVFQSEGSAKPLPPGIPGMVFDSCSFA